MEKSQVIVEFKKFISVLKKIPSFSSKFIFHRFLRRDSESTDSKIGEIFLILQSSITVSKQELTINDINNIFEQKFRSNSFLMPSDPEFIPILNYFFRNREDFLIDREDIIYFLQEKIKNLQNSIWIENQSAFSFGNSFQPDCIINFLKNNENTAFIFQINNLNLIFSESGEINNLNKKISLLNKQIEQKNQKGNISQNLEDKQVKNENTIQKLKNELNSTKNEFKTNSKQLKRNLHVIKNENGDLISENKQFKSETQRLSKLIQSLELDNQNLIEEKEEINEDSDVLRENLEECNLKISELLGEIKSLENLNSQLESSNVQLSDQNKSLKVKIRKNASKIKEILNEIDSR